MNEDNTEGNLNNMSRTEAGNTGTPPEGGGTIGNRSGGWDRSPVFRNPGVAVDDNQDRRSPTSRPGYGVTRPDGGFDILNWFTRGGALAEQIRRAQEADDTEAEEAAEKELGTVLAQNPLIDPQRYINKGQQMDQLAASQGGAPKNPESMTDEELDTPDPYYGTTPRMQLRARGIEKAAIPDQVAYVSDLMSELEATKQSYGSLQSNPEFVILIRNLHKLSREAQQFFKARYTIYETWLKLPYLGGAVKPFVEGVGAAAYMDLQATMLAQPEVADALMEIEERANKFKSGTNKPAQDNIIFAGPVDRQRLQEEMALNLAVRAGEIRKEKQIRDGKEVETYVYPEGKNRDTYVRKYIWAIRQADTLHRLWFRTAFKNGLVFKENVPDSIRQELLSLNPKEISERWEEFLKYVSFPDSFTGNGEFGPTRLVWDKLFLQKSARGEGKLRKYLAWGSGDFLSYKIDGGFLKKGSNFLDGKGFNESSLVYIDNDGNAVERDASPFFPLGVAANETDKQRESRETENKRRVDALAEWKRGIGDKFIGTVYVKNVGNQQTSERVLIRRNGIWEIFDGIDHNQQGRFRFNNVNWRVLDEDFFPNDFYYRKADLAETVRNETMGADKILRDPKIGNLLKLRGQLENYAPIEEAIEKEFNKGNEDVLNNDGTINYKKAENWIKNQREGGVIFREDAFSLLGQGLLEFQSSKDFSRRYGQPKINMENVDDAIRTMVASGELDPAAANQLRINMFAFHHSGISQITGGNELAGLFMYHGLLTNRKVRPGNTLLDMLLLYFKLGFQGFGK